VHVAPEARARLFGRSLWPGDFEWRLALKTVSILLLLLLPLPPPPPPPPLLLLLLS